MKVNQSLFDPYSIAHAGAGVVAASLGLSLTQTVVLHTIFEAAENLYLKPHPTHKKYFPDSTTDSIANIVGDTISVVTGWIITNKYGNVQKR